MSSLPGEFFKIKRSTGYLYLATCLDIIGYSDLSIGIVFNYTEPSIGDKGRRCASEGRRGETLIMAYEPAFESRIVLSSLILLSSFIISSSRSDAGL